MSDSIRPAVESTVGQVEDMTRKLNNNSPRIAKIIENAEGLTTEAQGYLLDNRENVKHSIAAHATCCRHSTISSPKIAPR